MLITSVANQIIKETLELKERKARSATGLFLIEGTKELLLAKKSNFLVVKMFYQPEIINQTENKLLQDFDGDKYEVSQRVFEKLAYRENSGGLVAVVQQKNFTLPDIKLSAAPLVLVLENIEKPGNLGAILRTAGAAGVELIVTTDQSADLYNPNTIRASLGVCFALPVVSVNNQEALDWLKKNRLLTYAAATVATKKYSEPDYRSGTAFVLGSEKDGLSEFWLTNCAEQILIPMAPGVDSLNLSVSAALLLFEAVRQRGK